jgi:hypothetical protein
MAENEKGSETPKQGAWVDGSEPKPLKPVSGQLLKPIEIIFQQRSAQMASNVERDALKHKVASLQHEVDYRKEEMLNRIWRRRQLDPAFSLFWTWFITTGVQTDHDTPNKRNKDGIVTISQLFSRATVDTFIELRDAAEEQRTPEYYNVTTEDLLRRHTEYLGVNFSEADVKKAVAHDHSKGYRSRKRFEEMRTWQPEDFEHFGGYAALAANLKKASAASGGKTEWRGATGTDEDMATARAEVTMAAAEDAKAKATLEGAAMTPPATKDAAVPVVDGDGKATPATVAQAAQAVADEQAGLKGGGEPSVDGDPLVNPPAPK